MGKPKRQRQFGGLRRRYKDNSKWISHKEVE